MTAEELNPWFHTSLANQSPPTSLVVNLSLGKCRDSGEEGCFHSFEHASTFQRLHTWLLADEQLRLQGTGWQSHCLVGDAQSMQVALRLWPWPGFAPHLPPLPFSPHPWNPIHLRPHQGWVTRGKSQESPEPMTRISSQEAESLCKQEATNRHGRFLLHPLLLLLLLPPHTLTAFRRRIFSYFS